MRYFYSFLLYLSLPFIVLRLLWRSRKDKAYRQRLAERFGFYPSSSSFASSSSFKDCIWIHVVSVGESVAATPFIQALQQLYPQSHFIITTMTPTGAARVQKTFAGIAQHVYIPYDFPGAVNRFIKTMQPKIALIFETEIWPNLLAACQKHHIPICLINGRLSAKSARGYQRIAKLAFEMVNRFALITAVGEQDAKRFIALGAPKDRICVTGNIKFDLKLKEQSHKDQLKQQLGGDHRFIWVAASTHPGEEEMMIAAHQALQKRIPHSLLILVPRHVDRAASIAKLCDGSFHTVRHSECREGSNPLSKEVAIYLGDTMGELMLFYAVADVAFVGGSLVTRGGHNMIEPALLSKPILTGPHLFNFVYESELFFEANALIKVANGEELAQQLILLAENRDLADAMGRRARAIVDSNCGALAKQLALVQGIIDA